jgi:ribosome-associated protein
MTKTEPFEEIDIPESELTFEALHAAGPGGQNINKVATAVRLTFDPRSSSILDEPTRERLIHIAGSHLDRFGRVIVLARRFRSQEMNRKDAIDRLKRMISQARVPPVARHPTRPTLASRERRLHAKANRKRIKESRRNQIAED